MKKQPKTKKVMKNRVSVSKNKLRQKKRFSLPLVGIIIFGFAALGIYLLLVGKAETSTEYKGYYMMIGKSVYKPIPEDLKNPLVAGLSVRVNWSDVEPTYGQYDFKVFDDAINASVAAGNKPMMIRVMFGYSSTKPDEKSGLPSWLFSPHGGNPAAETIKFDVASTGYNYNPVFWDKTTQADWKTFVSQLANHTVNGKKLSEYPNLILFPTAPWKHYGEPYMPGCPENGTEAQAWISQYKASAQYKDWNNNSKADYDDVRNAYNDASLNFYDKVFADNFPTQPLAKAGGLGLCDADGKYNADKANINRHPFLAKEFQTSRSNWGNYPQGTSSKRGFFIQYNGLNASPDGPETFSRWVGENYNPVDGKVNKGIIGYQMIGGVSGIGGGGVLVSPDQFATSIQNAVNYHASYVEVQQPVLRAAIANDTADGQKIRAALTANQDKLFSTVTTTTPPPPPDTTKPTVSITAPSSGATVSGSSLAVTANASDNTTVTKVDFLVDGSLNFSDSSDPYTTGLDTTGLSNGSHTVTAKAYDAAGNNASTSVAVNVANSTVTPPPPPPPPPPPVETPSNFTLLSRNFVASTGFNLQWDPVSGATNYKLYRNGSELTAANITKATSGKIVAFDNTVKGFTGYTYTVTALDNSGQESEKSTSRYGRCDWFIAWFCR